MSRPTRARGLKRAGVYRHPVRRPVAPHAGAWIETLANVYATWIERVAPHAGAWIETGRRYTRAELARVAPHAGAWIETTAGRKAGLARRRRAPRGRVD